jgi:hypothetical protein
MVKRSRKYVALFFISIILFLLPCIAGSAEEPAQKAAPGDQKVSVEDIIPLTEGNLRGHKMLYNEGWFVVTSSKRAFEFAKEQSIISSKTALRRALKEVSSDSADYKDTVKSDVQDAAQTGKDVVATGTAISAGILETTHALGKTELAYANANFHRAMDAFVRGNLTIAQRTQEERQELANLPGNYFKNLNSDFSNIIELADSTRKRFAGKIDAHWEEAFQKAGREFKSEYEKSGDEQNSLMALGPILHGYLKAFYHGFAAPTSKTIVKTGVKGVSYVVFLPIAGTSLVAGRTVQSVGLTVCYAGKTGVKIVSPTLEGGLLSGLSLLSLSSVPVTYAAGGALGAVNQVAFTTAGPAAGIAEGAVTGGAHTAGYVGLLIFDAAEGATKVVINQAASGVVLGYNALTAVPTHALLGVTDVAVFLAWDGPRLVIASAQGRIKSSKDPKGESYSLGDLPVGTVVDLKKLEKEEGVKVDVLSTDSAVIRNVLEKIPTDARGGHDDRQIK